MLEQVTPGAGAGGYPSGRTGNDAAGGMVRSNTGTAGSGGAAEVIAAAGAAEEAAAGGTAGEATDAGAAGEAGRGGQSNFAGQGGDDAGAAGAGGAPGEGCSSQIAGKILASFDDEQSSVAWNVDVFGKGNKANITWQPEDGRSCVGALLLHVDAFGGVNALGPYAGSHQDDVHFDWSAYRRMHLSIKLSKVEGDLEKIGFFAFVARSDNYSSSKEIGGEVLSDHLWHDLVVEFDPAKRVETYGLTAYPELPFSGGVSPKVDVYIDDVWLE
jgi:hypothetical protein